MPNCSGLPAEGAMDFFKTMIASALIAFGAWFVLSLMFSISNASVPEWALLLASALIGMYGGGKLAD